MTTNPTTLTRPPTRSAPRRVLDAALALPRPLLVTGVAFAATVVGGTLGALRGALVTDVQHPVTVTASALLSGRTFHAAEARLDATLPGRSALVATANTARYLTTRGASDEVRLGQGGWIFLASELAPHPDAARHMQQRADLTAQLARVLAARGVTLLVAVSPNKSRVEAAHLSGGALPAWLRAEPGYREYQALLRARGVLTADLLTPMQAAVAGADQYYRTDTHWNQAGARTAARAVAARVRALAGDLPPATFRTTAAPATPRTGDLLRLMGLHVVPDALRPPTDTEATETTVSDGGGGGLLGDAPQVVLAGSSYGLRGNFEGAVQTALGSAITNVSREGADFSGSLRSYLRDPAFTDTPPRVLVWEIPERFLPLPVAAEDHAPLAPF
ncbi:alginate O-acetyltransferase complex protein AlgJ [Deinococcus metalli]|uniref:Alginate O-acetyltransferase complex protein AlgJ n=1 Tax=Deinococcus metalli TaxID=1141878 RepID=A0A7W8NPD8_9DEIO|nr:cell division protein FtsQ [Deinococcus metalli]MBB5375650.1 alginate O-acetyltransferase complex protein AlgJ [Deinococcus metalli]GHF38081.1 cell division protein FtsQ [Deinococcus metalli]